MNNPQKTVDEILRRAREYLTHEEPQHGPIRLPPGASLHAVARALVGGWTSKSDLINIFTSALNVIEEEAQSGTVYVLEERQTWGGYAEWHVVEATYDKEQALEWEREDDKSRCVTPVTPMSKRQDPKENV